MGGIETMRADRSRIALLIVSAFVGGTVSGGLFPLRSPLAAQSGSPLPPPPRSLPDSPESSLLATSQRFADVVERIRPTVVAIDAVKATPAATESTPTRKKPTEESGSGVIVRFEGMPGVYVVTNNHVIAGAHPSDILMTLADGRILRPEAVLSDPESDVALLRLPVPVTLVAPLGDSEQIRVGEWVLAFGSPFGLNQSVTHGIISARDRGQISLGNTIRIKEFLQTDAAINPGSSGGPLVDVNGRVVGINTAIASNNGNNSGVSFSVPVNLVKRVAMQLLSSGTVSRGYLGIQLAPTLQPAAALKLGLDRVWGALVESVHPGGPAALAGIRAGDVITRLDTTEIRDENHLINLISRTPAGQRIRLTVWRNRQWHVVDVTVAAWNQASLARSQ
jgi:serine protease Do